MNNDVHQKDSVDKMHISISSFKLKASPAFAVFLLLFYAVVIFYAFVFAADSNMKVDFSFWIALIFFLAFPVILPLFFKVVFGIPEFLEKKNIPVPLLVVVITPVMYIVSLYFMNHTDASFYNRPDCSNLYVRMFEHTCTPPSSTRLSYLFLIVFIPALYQSIRDMLKKHAAMHKKEKI